MACSEPRPALLPNQSRIKQLRFRCLRTGCLLMMTKLWSDVMWVFTVKTRNPIVQGKYFGCGCCVAYIVIFTLPSLILQTSSAKSWLQTYTFSLIQFKGPKMKHFSTSSSILFPTSNLDVWKHQAVGWGTLSKPDFYPLVSENRTRPCTLAQGWRWE